MLKNKFIRRKSDHLNWCHKLLMVLAIVPFILIGLGTNGIIEASSPELLSSFQGVAEGFFSHFSAHMSILIGAFLVTLIIWDITHDSWRK